MKALYFFVAVALLGTAAAYPNKENSKCALLTDVPLPDLELNNEMFEPSAIDDPLRIRNISITLNEKIIKGTYSLTNGVIEGLSTLTYDFDYIPMSPSIKIGLNASIKRVKLEGLYEIVNGQANLTFLGAHTFSGKGPLAASISNVIGTLDVTLRVDPETQHISIAALDIDFHFENASIVAENLVVDGIPVVWEEINENIKSMFEAIWVEARIVNIELIQQEVNRLLKGCTLMDLILGGSANWSHNEYS